MNNLINQESNLTFVIVPNKLEPDINTTTVVQYEDDKTVLEYITELVPNSETLTFNIAINGNVIETQEQLDGLVLQKGDVISVKSIFEGPLIVAFAAYAATTIGAAAFLTELAGPIIGGMLYAGFVFGVSYAAQKLVNALGLGNTDKTNDISNTATYSWDGARNSYAEGLSIPIIFGTVKVAGTVIDQFAKIGTSLSEYGTATLGGADLALYTSASSNSYLNVLLAICGNGGDPIDSITDIRINGQISSQYPSVDVFTRLGTPDQTAITEFNDLVDSQSFNQRLMFGVNHTNSTNGDAVEQIDISFSAPNGLYHINDSGDTEAQSVAISVELYIYGTGDFVQIGQESSSFVIHGAANSTAIYETLTIKNLPPDKYKIVVSRVSADSIGLKTNTTVYLASIQETVTQPMRYPGIALYGFKMLATDQLSGSTPTFTALATRSQCKIYNIYYRDWMYISATNPAWATLSFLTYHNDVSTDRVIFEEFQSWAATCDELIDDGYGGLRKRYVVNIELNTSDSVWNQAQKIAKIGRAILVRRGSRIGVFCDRPETGYSHIFSSANIIEGSFQLQYTSTKDRANAVEIQYFDPEYDYTTQTVSFYSDDYDTTDAVLNKASSTFDAVLPRQQVINDACYLMNSNKHIIKAIQFKAASDSFSCTVGDIVSVQHNVPDFGKKYSGRIISATENTVTLDQTITITESMTIQIRLYDDEFVERIITEIGTSNTFTVTAPFPTIPVNENIYIIGLTSIKGALYRIHTVNRNQDQTATISCVEYNSLIYDDTGRYIEVPYVYDIDTPIASNMVLFAGDGYMQITWNTDKPRANNDWTVYIENRGIVTKIVDTTYMAYRLATFGLTHGEHYIMFAVCKGDLGAYSGSNYVEFDW